MKDIKTLYLDYPDELRWFSKLEYEEAVKFAELITHKTSVEKKEKLRKELNPPKGSEELFKDQINEVAIEYDHLFEDEDTFEEKMFWLDIQRRRESKVMRVIDKREMNVITKEIGKEKLIVKYPSKLTITPYSKYIQDTVRFIMKACQDLLTPNPIIYRTILIKYLDLSKKPKRAEEIIEALYQIEYSYERKNGDGLPYRKDEGKWIEKKSIVGEHRDKKDIFGVNELFIKTFMSIREKVIFGKEIELPPHFALPFKLDSRYFSVQVRMGLSYMLTHPPKRRTSKGSLRIGFYLEKMGIPPLLVKQKKLKYACKKMNALIWGFEFLGGDWAFDIGDNRTKRILDRIINDEYVINEFSNFVDKPLLNRSFFDHKKFDRVIKDFTDIRLKYRKPPETQ